MNLIKRIPIFLSVFGARALLATIGLALILSTLGGCASSKTEEDKPATSVIEDFAGLGGGAK